MKATAHHYAESLLSAHAAGTRSTEELVRGLLSVLVRKRALHLAPKILTHLIENEAEQKGLVEIVIETAHKVDSATKKKLLAKAADLYPVVQLETTFLVQPELGAGFRIRGKGREWDNSFASAVKKLRNQLTRL